jgi:MFS family permease
MTELEDLPTRARIPSTYYWWLFGVVWTLTGMAVLTFGLVWIATDISGSAAGLVLSAGVVTRLILSIPGGSLADRFGAWPVMVITDGIMVVLALVLVIVVSLIGAPLWLLVTVSIIVGVADALYRPASGAFPRYLVPVEAMRSASAARQIVFQFLGIAGPALGAMVIVALTLTGSAAAAAVGFAVMFLILLALRNRRLPISQPIARESIASSTRQGLTYALTTPKIRAILILLVTVSGFVIPLTTLLVPLHVRAQAWPDISAGLLAGCFGAGLLISTMLFLFRAHSKLTRFPSLAALAFTALGMLGLSIARTPELGALGVIAAGLGTGYFIARAAPVLLTDVPDQYLSRVQGINLFAQTLPLLFTNNLFGWLSDTLSSSVAIQSATAGILAAVGALSASGSARKL